VTKQRPRLETARLLLRPLTLADAPTIQRLAGAREIAATTLLIPHPYPDGAAEEWISGQQERFDQGAELVLGIELREGAVLCGAIGLKLEPAHARAELGYWIGVPWWGRGYCTEAAAALLEHAFTALGLRRVFAVHFAGNPASGRVLRKLGMTHEGRLRQHDVKWGERIDLEVYGILAQEWLGGRGR
jgi:RimJ/RimL family protein N-acetyltransferase